MAGGPSTDALVAAVSASGGLGFLATAYRDPESVTASITALRADGVERFGANLFVPEPADAHVVDEPALAAYRDLLTAHGRRWNASPGTPQPYSTASYDAVLDVVIGAQVPWVSFTFGLPSAADIERLHHAGATVVITVTDLPDAHAAADRGADVLWVQGPDAGGHRSTFTVAARPPSTPLTDVLRDVRAVLDLPVIASGGVASGDDVARLLTAGADAVGVGTLLLRTPEAGTSAPHRAALADPHAPVTVLTRAFSGRVARGIDNAFHRDLHTRAPAQFPEVNTLTGPLRAAATAAGDPDGVTLWAGTGFRAARDAPAGDVVTDLWANARRTGALDRSR